MARTSQKDLNGMAHHITRVTGMRVAIDWAYGAPRLVSGDGSREISPRLPSGQLMDWMRAFLAGWDAATRPDSPTWAPFHTERRDNPSFWALRQDVTYPHWVRTWESQDGERRYTYDVTPVSTRRGTRYEVSYKRADGDFDARYRAAGGTGGYVGQARTREAAFRMAARHANGAGLVVSHGN